jgi:hypothetical protein
MPKQINGSDKWPMPLVGRYRKVGERLLIDGKPYRVVMVNPCRARCVPLKKRRVTIKDKVFNTSRTFMANERSLNIAATTEG